MSPLLDLLFTPCTGLIELRAKPVHEVNGVPTCFLAHDDANRLTQFVGEHLHGHSLFFGVATRRNASSGTLANCLALPALFCDLDFKLTIETEARRRLYEFPLAPSAVVLSGHGLHVYWMLREPLLLQDPAECARAKSLLRRIAHYLGADLVSAEPAHCLRLPGTLNPKYDPPRQARLDHLADALELQYHASEFDDLLPMEPVETKPIGAFVAPEKILDGERNATLYKLTRSLKAKGLDCESIRAALHVENRKKCAPPLPDDEVDRMIAHAWTQPDREAFLPKGTPTPTRDDEPPSSVTPAELGLGLGAFLALDFPPTRPLIEGLLSDDGGGWISGEEKLGKSYYAVEEALCLALGLPVCGRFAVPARCKVLFIEEEDSPARAHRRVKQLLRGHGLDPDDAALRVDLNAWFRISVWAGFTLDEAPQVEILHRTIAAFQPTVVYLDVLRKLTTKNLNKGDEAGVLLKILDDLRRAFGVLFRVLAHNRKVQGAFRAGRGSQELAGSHQLGAWGENSLFFEPIGKTHGAIKITVQCKDSAPIPAFGLRFQSEGPAHDPTLVRLHAEELSKTSAAEELKAHVFDAISSLPTEEAKTGDPGVSREAICTAVKKSSYPVRTAIQAMIDEGRVVKVGNASKQKKLYQVNQQ